MFLYTHFTQSGKGNQDVNNFCGLFILYFGPLREIIILNYFLFLAYKLFNPLITSGVMFNKLSL